MVTDGQVRKLFRDLEAEKWLAVAARRAGMDEKTARKYRTLGALPSTQKRPRTYRTRKDPLADLWQTVQERLEAEPRLHAKTLFDWLQKEPPGRLTQSQRRTFERRVQRWRATAGKARTVMFSQVHHAGDLAASDFTSMNALAVTIVGKRFDHLVYHFVLTYSRTRTATASHHMGTSRPRWTKRCTCVAVATSAIATTTRGFSKRWWPCATRTEGNGTPLNALRYGRCRRSGKTVVCGCRCAWTRGA